MRVISTLKRARSGCLLASSLVLHPRKCQEETEAVD